MLAVFVLFSTTGALYAVKQNSKENNSYSCYLHCEMIVW